MARTTFAGSTTVTAGTEAAVLDVTVDRVQTFLLLEVTVQSVGDPSGELEARVFRGESPIAPLQATATLVTDEILLDAEAAYQKGDTLQVRVENTGASDRTVSVLARGVDTRELHAEGVGTYGFDEDDLPE
jgi:hypothetical protein